MTFSAFGFAIEFTGFRVGLIAFIAQAKAREWALAPTFAQITIIWRQLHLGGWLLAILFSRPA